MESSLSIVIRAFVLFALMAVVPLLAISGVSVDGFLARFRGDQDGPPTQKPDVSLGDEVENFPFDQHPSRDPFPKASSPVLGKTDVTGDLPALDSTKQDKSSPPVVTHPPMWDSSRDAARPPAREVGFIRNEPEDSSSSDAPHGGDSLEGRERGTEAEISEILDRLNQLGAVYTRRETLGRGRLFRFRCEFPVPANAQLRRYFEASDTSESRAILRVAAEVENWRSQRRR